MSDPDQDESTVPRRQFFRAMAQDLLRAYGEFRGPEEPDSAPTLNQFPGPEQQQEALNELLSFLDNPPAVTPEPAKYPDMSAPADTNAAAEDHPNDQHDPDHPPIH